MEIPLSNSLSQGGNTFSFLHSQGVSLQGSDLSGNIVELLVLIWPQQEECIFHSIFRNKNNTFKLYKMHLFIYFLFFVCIQLQLSLFGVKK